MNISGQGKAGPFEDVLCLPDLRINLFSQKQAMRQNSHIALSADAKIFQVTLPNGRTFEFVFDGTFWIWDDDAALDPPLEFSAAAVSTNSNLGFPTLSQMAAPISHTGAVHEFLLLHFRVGHLNYTAMLRALQAGTWTGFQHSLQNIHLEQLPRCPVCLRMKNKHLPISNIGRFVQPRPGLLFHMDLKTVVRTRSINHEHYVVDIIDDNSDKTWIYCIRRKSDALDHAIKVFVDTVCRPRGINFFALRIDNGGELVSHETQQYCADNGNHMA